MSFFSTFSYLFFNIDFASVYFAEWILIVEN